MVLLQNGVRTGGCYAMLVWRWSGGSPPALAQLGWRTQESRQRTWRPSRKGRLKTSSAALFQATFEAEAALGAVRRFDESIGRILDQDRWDSPIESVGELRDALTKAERRAKLTKRETKSFVIDGHAR